MAAPSVWNTRSSGSDDVLRPSESFWQDVNRMHQVDADLERSIHEYAWEDQREPGMMELSAKGPGIRGHTDNGRRSEEGMNEEAVVFAHVFGPHD